MISCKSKLFKRFLFFSIVFLFFSLVYNQLTHASEAVRIKKIKHSTEHVKLQQEKIISSLKKIEGCLISNGGYKNE